MTLKLNGIEVDCIIGELPDERVRTQRLRVDVELDVPDTAAETDALADTVDYAALSRRIAAALAHAKCRMIERAAKVARDVCLAEPAVRSAKVSVTKSGAVPGLESAQVVYEGARRMDGTDAKSRVGAVVFDFGGVMTTSTMPKRVIALAREKGIDWDVFRRGFDAHRLDYDAGRLTLEEMYDLIWRDAGIEVSAETNAAFIAADSQSWLYRNERTLEWMKSLKARGFVIGILTNMAPHFARVHFRTSFADFIALADAMVVSGEVGLVKPHREIYDLMRERIGLPASALCFIDDLERNVAAAAAAGWRGIRFVSNEQVESDFERLLAE